MKIKVIGREFEATQALKAHVEERLERSVGNISHLLAAVDVRIGDLNGPRGGEDKYCSFNAFLREGSVLRVEETHEDLRTAIDFATGRLRRSILRTVRRNRAIQRKAPQAADS